MPTIQLQRCDADPDSLDSRHIWLWRNDPLTRQMSLSTDEIPWERHRAWYAQAVVDPRKILLLGSHPQGPLGMVRFDRHSRDEAEVSINLNPAMRGLGLSRPLLAAACAWGFEQQSLLRLSARIKSNNLRSLRIFAGVGFTLCHEEAGLQIVALSPDRLHTSASPSPV